MKIRFLFFFFLFAVSGLILRAQKLSSCYHLKGMLDSKIPVTMELVLADTSAMGSFYYDKYKVPVYVGGSISGEGKLMLEEFALQDSLTGIIKGKLNAGQLTGSWESPDGKKKFDLVMKEDYSSSFLFERKAINKNVPLFGDRESANDPFGQFDFSVCYPKSNSLHPDKVDCVQKLINEEVFDTSLSGPVLDNLLKNIFREFKAEYTSLQEMWEDEQDVHMFNWSVSQNMSIWYNEGDILTYLIDAYSYTGGAHGNWGTTAITIDLKSCSVVNPAEIFYEDKMESLSKLMEQKYRKNYDIPEDSPLSENLFVEKIYPNENALISPGGIEFMYNPYEIGPYAAGQIEIFLSWKEIRDYVKKDFSLYPDLILK